MTWRSPQVRQVLQRIVGDYRAKGLEIERLAYWPAFDEVHKRFQEELNVEVEKAVLYASLLDISREG